MVEPVEVEIMGHKAKIKWIKSHLQGVLHAKDTLSVYIELSKPIDGTVGFFVDIPVKNYGKEELLETIRIYAENDLQVMKERYRQEEEERKQREAREKDLDGLGEQLMNMLSK